MTDIEVDLIASASLDRFSNDESGIDLMVIVRDILCLLYRHEVMESKSFVFGILDQEGGWDRALVLKREGELLLCIHLSEA